MEFWTIEVVDGEKSALTNASKWHESYGDSLIEAAITHGAQEWDWQHTEWGCVFEVAFADEADWLRFRATPAVQAALDGVPDPVAGLMIYKGRGGSSGTGEPRRPRPAPLTGSAALPEPEQIFHASAAARMDPEPGINLAGV